MRRWLIVVTFVSGLLASAATAAEDGTLVPTRLRVPAVGEAGELRRAPAEHVEVDGRKFAIPRPGSWVSFPVEIEFDEAGLVVDAWAGEAEFFEVREDRLAPSPDAFFNPGELRRFRETAERAARESTFEIRGGERQRPRAGRRLLTIYWRVGFDASFDLLTLGPSFRRVDNVLLATGSPTVMLLSGAGRDYDVAFPVEFTEDEALSARGIPPDLVLAEGDDRCGVFLDRPPDVAGTAKLQRTDGKKIRPEYPEEARIYKVGGRIRLEAVVDESGRVRGAVVEKGAPGFPSLARAAVEAACRMEYLPLLVDGAPVPAAVPLEIAFELHGPTRQLLQDNPPPKPPPPPTE